MDTLSEALINVIGHINNDQTHEEIIDFMTAQFECARENRGGCEKKLWELKYKNGHDDFEGCNAQLRPLLKNLEKALELKNIGVIYSKNKDVAFCTPEEIDKLYQQHWANPNDRKRLVQNAEKRKESKEKGGQHPYYWWLNGGSDEGEIKFGDGFHLPWV